MKKVNTPMQEMFDQLKASKKDEYGLAFAIDMLLENEQAMLEKEKEVMCDFVEYCDEANRNYQETEESWCEDLTIDDMFDKRFNTK